jgi:phospholipid/cholesterol/gamma-HCH transport system substrate-binding protein
MEPEARYTLVGATLIAIVVAAAAFSVWLSRAGVASDFRFYTIYFEHQSLDGLQIGSDVNMKGIKVGRVEKFALDRGNINRVNVKVRVLRKTPVSTNTVAVIERNLLTGIARVDLQTPGTPGPPLEETSANEDYPVIAEGNSNIEQFAQTANSLVVQADVALAKLGDFLSDENRKNFAQALAGVRDLTVGLSRRLDTFDQTAVALTDMAQSVRKSSDTINKVAAVAGEQIPPLSRDVQVTLKDMQATLRDISAAARRLENDGGALAQRAESAADIGALELRATVQQLRTGMDALNRTLDRLQDPRAALLGPSDHQLGPGERIK